MHSRLIYSLELHLLSYQPRQLVRAWCSGVHNYAIGKIVETKVETSEATSRIEDVEIKKSRARNQPTSTIEDVELRISPIS